MAENTAKLARYIEARDWRAECIEHALFLVMRQSALGVGYNRPDACGGKWRLRDRHHARRRPPESAIDAGRARGIPVVDRGPECFAVELECIGEFGEARAGRQHHVVEL